MRADLVVGSQFPDIELLDQSGVSTRISTIASNQPLILAFSRGWW
jgi:peroxiredoxin